MAEAHLFVALSSRRIAKLIAQATRHVCYAAPGIHDEPAEALVNLKRKSPSVSITVNLDFDEKTLQMGYGCLSAVETLSDAKIHVSHFAGFRSSILIVDNCGWVFTPTALCLESEPHSDETPNALVLAADQVRELLIRLSPRAREEAIISAEAPEEAERIAATPLDVSIHPIEPSHFDEVKQAIDLAPPVQFDVARQVRVFQPYLQYVELSLTGAAIQRHRVRIPKSIQHLGSANDLEGRLQTTFDLIDKSGEFSSKSLESDLNDLRNNFTRSLGEDHGRIILKSAKSLFLERIDEFCKKLESHQKKIEEQLQSQINDSKKKIIDYYLPIARNNPPDALVGQLFSSQSPNDDDIRAWLDKELGKAFPKAEKLAGKMKLKVRYKDVTFETLNQPDFLEAVKQAFPGFDWDKTYSEFKAVGEAHKDNKAILY